ncbi:MAG: PhoH family protein [Proteobacteria bacterium]|nr:PhoH family protein [Pseudomonadota bacterium]
MITPQTLYLEFPNNQLLQNLVGSHDVHILRLEQRLGVSIALRGNQILITGAEPEISYAKTALQYLYAQLAKGYNIDVSDIDAAIRLSSASVSLGQEKDEIAINTKRRIVFPRSSKQAQYIQAMQTNDLVFGVGPAGTGKTYLAVAIGVAQLLSGKIERIILSRPAVEAGEKLGFLPGDMREKVDPYLRPIYDALHDMIPVEQVGKRIANGEIEIAPLAFMRGRTLSNAFVILDEAQNTTPMQMKMFLTRLGTNSKMVITGDLTQVDLPTGVISGLKQAIHILDNVEGIQFIHFTEEDVVRHPIVARIVSAYNAHTTSVENSTK